MPHIVRHRHGVQFTVFMVTTSDSTHAAVAINQSYSRAVFRFRMKFTQIVLAAEFVYGIHLLWKYDGNEKLNKISIFPLHDIVFHLYPPISYHSVYCMVE